MEQSTTPTSRPLLNGCASLIRPTGECGGPTCIALNRSKTGEAFRNLLHWSGSRTGHCHLPNGGSRSFAHPMAVTRTSSSDWSSSTQNVTVPSSASVSRTLLLHYCASSRANYLLRALPPPPQPNMQISTTQPCCTASPRFSAMRMPRCRLRRLALRASLCALVYWASGQHAATGA